MRFFEYEAREIVKRAGIPVTNYGFAKDPQTAREDAERIGGPVVIKSQVLSGGRMKAGGVKFADTPRGGRATRAGDPRARDRRAHAARRARGPEGRGRAGVLRRRRLGRHAQAPRDDLLSGRRHRHRAGCGRAAAESRPPPDLDDPSPLRLPGQGGDRGDRRFGIGADAADADPCAARGGVPEQRHDARRDQSAGPARRRLVRRARRAHGDGERGAAAPQGTARASSALASTRPARRASRRPSSSPARKSTPPTIAAWPGTSPSSTATSAS